MYNTSMDAVGVASIGVSLLMIILFLIVWFFVSRASVRANEQVQLLREIVEQQKQQIELLNVLLRNTQGDSQGASDSDMVDTLDFKGFIPER
ncbi:YebO family protein [Yersinia ruckeri]|uniref:YebO family protein n=1 Tax=Yersinia ruckeri TaxID=29486 RepID=UPI0005ABC141|nr:YebO family protein [Yersinia ruckeri]AJI96555.1 yebO-like family protein [Yersinia ruckeri]EKN4181059.1 YebO family protein [Yersinia ruckeri]EKN4686596.1 YebO family protein [Yersinia ruckeri]EKN4691116.1 YebO family protein [Yersinia ruckeri]EKN4693435.1 YebO family protein [Yersinia ruckeri]